MDKLYFRLTTVQLVFHVCRQQAIESAIGGNAYQHSKVNQWTTSVVEQTLSQLTKLGKPFKYIGELSFLFSVKAGAVKRTEGNLHREMGEQDHVLYRQCLWTCNMIALGSFILLFSTPALDSISTQTVNTLNDFWF
ncbi:dynein light chain tctex-type 1 isoform x2 [Limosa lapponica baueri]|uniref:Dynein light chain tctex-type 1 isoform x2 n=1 Tax=Limosa lapponica baueri TaxID=1758121 RepID=A0A2I0SZV1_LIMLA|nr:dynein light chain tctex-type 1 isoform x2 [Limosa lapponica baueri]